MSEGLNICKGGRLMYHDWNPDSEEWEDFDVTDHVLDFTQHYCGLADGVTLRDVIQLVDSQKETLRPILGKYFFEEYLAEAKTANLKLAGPDETKVNQVLKKIVLEVDGHAHWNTDKKCYDLFDSYDLHAVGHMVDDEDQIIIIDNHEMDHIKISLGFQPINKFLNLPFVLSDQYQIRSREKLDKFIDRLNSSNPLVRNFCRLLDRLGYHPKEKVLASGNRAVTLGSILHVVFDEFSFFGSPAMRDEEFKEVNKMIAEANAEGLLTTISFDELFDT